MTHPTITNMQAMQVARGIGVIVEAGLAPVVYSHHQLHVFAQAIYKLGRNATLEEMKREIDEISVVPKPVDNTLGEVIRCFDAAIAEGLYEAIAETTDERLKDLLERRVMHAYHIAIGPF